MKLASETVRAFLASIDVKDEAIEAGLARTDDPRVTQDVLYRVIAHAKERDVTGERVYHDAIRTLQALLKGGGRFTTKAAPLLASAAKRYEALAAECDAAVVRWEWRTGDPYALAPYHAERHRFSKGKKVPAPTSKKAREGLHAFGFDAEGRLRVAQQHNAIGHYETFFTHAPDRIEARHYSYARHAPINAQLVELGDGRPVAMHFEATGGKSIERYTWAGDRVVRIAIDRPGAPAQELDLRHDALGELEAIVDVSALDAKFHRAIWERPKKGLSLAKLLPRVRALLLELLEVELRKRTFGGAAYALALVVDSEAYDHLLPPRIAVATVRERDAFLAAHPDRAADFLWSPAEWDEGNTFDVWDDRMKALVEPANHLLWTEERHAEAMKLAHGIAKELNTTALPIDRDPDFVVFACELDGEDGRAGIAKAAPAKLRKRLAPLL